MSQSHEKLAELILYIANRRTDEKLDPGRLGRTLYYADFLFYARHGRSITGERYVRMQDGPAPEALLDARARMANRQADLSAFSAEEIATVDYVLGEMEGQSAGELSRRFGGWRLAEDGEEIPYPTAFISGRAPTAEDSAFARELGEKARRELAGEAA